MSTSVTAQWLSTRDAAAYLGVSPRTLQTWRARCQGPRYARLSANRCVYSLADLEEFAASRLVGGVR